jgi:hypothetical protein
LIEIITRNEENTTKSVLWSLKSRENKGANWTWRIIIIDASLDSVVHPAAPDMLNHSDLHGKGVTMRAFVLIKIRAGEVSDVVRQLRELPEITEARMTFGPYDAVAIVDSQDLSSIGSLIASTIQPISGVEQTLTCLAADE